jgi:hypothetical protein
MDVNNWALVASDFVDGIEAEAKANTKKFYNEDDGSNRAKSAINKLDALRSRLTPFVRA